MHLEGVLPKGPEQRTVRSAVAAQDESGLKSLEWETADMAVRRSDVEVGLEFLAAVGADADHIKPVSERFFFLYSYCFSCLAT